MLNFPNFVAEMAVSKFAGFSSVLSSEIFFVKDKLLRTLNYLKRKFTILPNVSLLEIYLFSTELSLDFSPILNLNINTEITYLFEQTNEDKFVNKYIKK